VNFTLSTYRNSNFIVYPKVYFFIHLEILDQGQIALSFILDINFTNKITTDVEIQPTNLAPKYSVAADI